MNEAMRDDLELLGIQREMSLDDDGRVRDLCGITLVIAHHGRHASSIGADVPDTLADRVARAASAVPADLDAREPEAGLEPLRRLLEAALNVPMTVRGGPSYVLDSVAAARSDARIVRSDALFENALRDMNPGNWEGDEWDDVLDGRLGPWAMAIVDDAIVSIAHTPLAMTDRTAECGIWTLPDARRRGHAAATVAAWADVLRPSGRRLFYATDAGNVASQGVAARLGLREIGWIWHIEPKDAGAPRRHPLSRPR